MSQKETPIYMGSVKNVFRRKKGTLDFEHTDFFSVFDIGRHPQAIPDKGIALCKCAVQSFKIAKALGIRTHFVEQIDERTIRVLEFLVPDKNLTPEDRNYVIPIEWIDRQRVAGSIERAFKKGTKKPTDYGFATDDPPALGTPFPYPVHDLTTKREAVDREIGKKEACEIAGLTDLDVEYIWRQTDKLNGGFNLAAHIANFLRPDGKKEWAFDQDRQIVLADSAGTMDEDRYWPIAEFKNGNVVNYSKEYIRQLFVDNGFFAEVQAARDAGKALPPYPDLTEDEIEECSRRYTEFADSYSRVSV